ncbi:hypothetical protein [Jeotgalibacillus soli]|uniref:Methyltransferase FkbM n=1 Tax=Jeotgalibacillus soli TaxID=889306 RepID=A0A0C2W1B7_9BACL|nr:hypothetical protein [Jeotgalibacillus soli]KIL49923.1 methyltransferase FkbM [Jeotgalibacillus soli]
MKTPVVFIIFNRPDTTKIVFEKIRDYKPEELFVIADGPRTDRLNETELCKQARDVINVDWDCNVTFFYSEMNLGCQKRISSGLDLVFNKVERAIILEDDCVPHLDFFAYCEELLEWYADDTRIMAVSGDNFQNADFNIPHSYYFSLYNHVWGWATWRRAWKHFDVDMNLWPAIKKEGLLKDILDNKFEEYYWENIFEKTYQKQVDSWAYAWTFACWIQNGLTILPKRNLVSNIGFGENATHTKGSDQLTGNLPVYAIEKPFLHPNFIIRNKNSDSYTSENIFGMKQQKESLSSIGLKKIPLYERILKGEKSIFNSLISAGQEKLALYGAGRMGRFILKHAADFNIKIQYLIDSNPNLHDQLISGAKVISLNEVRNNDIETIVVTIEGDHDKEIIKKLYKDHPEVNIISWKELI